MPRNTLRILPALVALALPAAGGESHANLGVFAAVLPRTEIRIDVPEQLVVTSADLRRGTLPAQPFHVSAWSNTPHGLELTLQAPEGLFASLHVQGPGVDARLPGAGGAFAWRWQGRPGFRDPASVDLKLTAQLLPGAPIGRFVWPVHVAGRALDQ
jgi:hypothetical protein